MHLIELRRQNADFKTAEKALNILICNFNLLQVCGRFKKSKIN